MCRLQQQGGRGGRRHGSQSTRSAVAVFRPRHRPLLSRTQRCQVSRISTSMLFCICRKIDEICAGVWWKCSIANVLLPDTFIDDDPGQQSSSFEFNVWFLTIATYVVLAEKQCSQQTADSDVNKQYIRQYKPVVIQLKNAAIKTACWIALHLGRWSVKDFAPSQGELCPDPANRTNDWRYFSTFEDIECSLPFSACCVAYIQGVRVSEYVPAVFWILCTLSITLYALYCMYIILLHFVLCTCSCTLFVFLCYSIYSTCV